MTHPDFRAELQALLNAVHDLRIEGGEPKHSAFRAALDRARTALAATQQGDKGLHGKYIIHRSMEPTPITAAVIDGTTTQPIITADGTPRGPVGVVWSQPQEQEDASDE